MGKQAKRTKTWTGDTTVAHALDAAVKLVKANANAKFDESIEIAVNLGVDPRHADQQVRGVVALPSGTGRDVRVAVIAKDAKAAEATAAGADIVGGEELVERIQGGFMDFDRVIATPDMIQWAPGLPKTRSGKIMRRILRKIAANEYDNLGDTSTLADPSVVKDLIASRAKD